jgi:predicted HicB family RNase H-like nuclease
MPRKGFKNLTIKEELHEKIKEEAKKQGIPIQNLVEPILQAEVQAE